MFKSLFFIAGFLACSLALFAQQDSIKFNNRKYKREISIDVRGILTGSGGSALVYKVRHDKGDLIPVSYSDYRRFQVAISGTANFAPADTFSFIGIGFQTNNSDKADLRFQVLLGKERVHYFNRFNLYYGVDVGLLTRYFDGVGLKTPFQTNSGVTYVTLPCIAWEIGATAVPFFGMKYRIGDRFSISAESSFALEYVFENLKYFSPIDGKQLVKTHQSTVRYGISYLRLLTFNYHFYQY